MRHPLGFLCLPLMRDGVNGVCVHLFDDDMAPGPSESLVHAHSWALTSLVLHGRVTNCSVDVIEGVASPTHRVFEVRSDPDGTDDVRPTARVVSSELRAAQTNHYGDVYMVRPGEFHTTTVPDGCFAATLVLGNVLPGGTDLALGPLHGDAVRSVRELCDRQQTVAAVRTALRRIDAQDVSSGRIRTARP
ncbi:hypothetical protein [Streptomyces sp. IBSBF 2435]|uniref:hypothetical protein n=1 Tax=Streptomyces sp. IBSBF 2435 TaxID=2903531 RepID=UPI002FDBF104